MKLLKVTFILLFLIVSMGFVSAQDTSNDTLESEQTGFCTTSEFASFNELENNIINANATLEITRDYINDCRPDGIRIERDNLTINGNNHTIDGNGQNIFCIKGSNITINNLVFKNAFYDFGGAIYNDGALALNNVTFADNGAENIGGAIYNCGYIGLRGCVFADNSAGAAAGAVFNSGAIVLSDCVFADNGAGDAGGAIYNIGHIGFNCCFFVDNGAVNIGGAISNFDSIDLISCVFADNGAGAAGGAIYVDGNASLSDCVFAENNAAAVAGAIFVSYGAFVDSNNVYFANNSANEGGAIYSDGNIALSGCGFAGNVAKLGGAVYVLDAGVAGLDNVSFADNSAERGGAIYDYGGMLDICNAFITSKKSARYGQIHAVNSRICIHNLTAVNMTASYSPAIYIDSSNLSLANSRFVNLTGDVSAGAISARNGGDIYISGCEFINTTSSRNAGAIHMDILGRGNGTGSVTILDTLFKNVRSGFGGAFIQLGGNLLLNGSDFMKSSAAFDGGAIYLSHVDAKISGCTFDSDSIGVFEDYPTYGGAIYFDCGNLMLNNSKFINTSAYVGSGAICIYDSLYEIANSTFGDGEAVHALFKRQGSQVIGCLGNFTVSDENVFYPYVIVGEGMNLTPNADELDFDGLPSRFDLRDYNWTSPVMYQGDMGACWEIANIGALESALLKSLGLSVELSANNMKNTMLTYSKYGSFAVEGGTQMDAVAYCLSWMGAFAEELDAYDEVGKISQTITGSKNIHIQDVVLNPRDCEIVNGDPRFKLAILKYGALSCSVYGFNQLGASNEFYNDETHAQYAYNASAGHMVCVVGWDDSFSRENFITPPPGDGAWICKNSWGTDFADGGYYYVSYYDTTLATGDFDGIAYSFENAIPYNKNYQYDFDGMMDFYAGESQMSYSNNFESCGDDLIAAVGTYFSNPGAEYAVEIKVNGRPVYTQRGVSPYYGYHTIRLDRYVPIKKGDNFSATITADEIPIIFSSNVRPNYAQGISYMFEDGSWIDLSDNGWIACLKVYTVGDDSRIIENKDIQLDYGSGSSFAVRVVTADGHAVVGGDVNFTIGGKTTTVQTDSEGIAEIEITAVPGTYAVTTSCNGQTCQNTVRVKLNQKTYVVALNRDIEVDYAGGKYFTVRVASADGKVAASGVWVKFTISGKTKTVQTDKNGMAKIKITQAPGRYTIKTTFNGKTCKNRVTVKHVLAASKITVKKTAKKFKLKARLKINGKFVKGKWVTFKFNGKTYKAKTNFRGMAQKTLKKNVIKRLRKGKTYTVKVTYLKDIIKSSVKAK